jgi:hypothetical protein
MNHALRRECRHCELNLHDLCDSKWCDCCGDDT